MISDLLLKWYEANKRDLPWRHTNSPYKIWLSEIILQQTRVNQGMEYYNRFIERYPSVNDLAEADMDDVLKLWQGLGYYTRARNLHETAIAVVKDHGGSFPSTYDQLSRLKGIGPYTAAAVASFAFGQAVPLTDGNVFRVISRLFDIDTPVNSTEGKKVILKLAADILNTSYPDTHNQAIMEFGAMVCTPRNPLCTTCVLAEHCISLRNGTVSQRPVKIYWKKTRTRYLNYLHFSVGSRLWIRKRIVNDIWNSLYEFPLVETSDRATFEELAEIEPWNYFLRSNSAYRFTGSLMYSHKLSHQQLFCTFFRVESDHVPDVPAVFIETPLPQMHKYAIPRVIERYLSDLS